MSGTAPRWVGWWFRGAAIYGAIACVALLLRPPAVTGTLFVQGFAGTALAFQAAFWMIGGDPVRHRALMVPAVLEKLAFVVPVLLLAAAGQAEATTLAAGAVDALLGLGFAMAWRATPRA